MKTSIITLHSILGIALLMPQMALAKAPSRKIARDTSASASKPAVKNDLVPVSVVTPVSSVSGLAANSYSPSPMVSTAYVNQPQDNSAQIMAMLAVGGSLLKNAFSGASSSSPSSVSDSTSSLSDAQVEERVYTNKSEDSQSAINAEEHNDEDIPASTEGHSSRRYIKHTGHLHSIKYDNQTAYGQCLAPVTNLREAKRILVRNNVKVDKTATSKDIVTLATGIQQLQLLSGNGSAKFVSGVVFKFPRIEKYSNQLCNGICMGKNFRDGNVAHLMHELGHYAGNSGLYAGYKKLGRCNLTKYSKIDYSAARARNEEFAEVFAAFVTSPAMLRDSKNPECRAAFDYMAKHYPNAHKYAICDRSALIAALGGGNSTQTASLENQADVTNATR